MQFHLKTSIFHAQFLWISWLQTIYVLSNYFSAEWKYLEFIICCILFLVHAKNYSTVQTGAFNYRNIQLKLNPNNFVFATESTQKWLIVTASFQSAVLYLEKPRALFIRAETNSTLFTRWKILQRHFRFNIIKAISPIRELVSMGFHLKIHCIHSQSNSRKL